MLKRLYKSWCDIWAREQSRADAVPEQAAPEGMSLASIEQIPTHCEADPWIRFMLLDEVAQGHTLQGIIGFNAIEFDTAHDFIQWLFPNRLASPVNGNAPLLTDLHVDAYAQLLALRQAVDSALTRFFDFLGIEEGAQGFTHGQNFEKGSRYWLCPLDHNHRRISRVLTFLCEMGRIERAEQALRFLVDAMTVQRLQDATAVRFWVGIVAAYRPELTRAVNPLD
jgi:hypothetical protein